MHSCLKVPEILSLIFDNFIEAKVDSPSIRRPWPFEGSRTLVNLATSCKFFTEPALDRLWFFAPDFDDLFDRLPDDAYGLVHDGHGDRHFTILRALKPQDFARFGYYSSKIRVLGTFYLGQNIKHAREEWQWRPGVHDLVLPALMSRNLPVQSLLPNLKLYNALMVDLTGHAWPLRASISPSLHSFCLCAGIRDHTPSLIEVVGKSIGKVADTLKGFAITLVREESLACEFVPSPALQLTICHFKGLQSLDILPFGVESATLSHLVGLSTLRTIGMTLKADQMQAFLQGGAAVSCHLQDIAFRTDSLIQCTNLLRRLDPPSLRSLNLVRRTASTEKWEVKTFLKTASKWKCMAKIATLEIQSPLSAIEPQDIADDITGEVINYLLSFSYLRVLRLSMNSHVTIGLDTLERIKTSWTDLEVLDLHERTTGTQPAITFFDAVKFIAACPRLTELRLRVDASSTDFGFNQVHDIQPSRQFATLDVCTSPLMEPGRPWPQAVDLVSQFLAFAYPNLKKFDYGWVYASAFVPPVNLPRNEQHHLNGWRAVGADLELLRREDYWY